MLNQPIEERLKSGRGVWSVEFFPPKDESGGAMIVETAQMIREKVKPDFVSITYGAGGGTRERTFRYAKMLKDECGFTVMPHLTCVGSSRRELEEILAGYAGQGFCNIMALRGDPPQGAEDFRPHPDGLSYASELVRLIRDSYPQFTIGVAGYPEVHPEAIDLHSDIAHLKHKVDQGASFVTTQLFYSNSAFLRFLTACREAGIKVPILPGLMPIRSAKQARRFCKDIPAELDAMLCQAGENEEALKEVGIEWTYRQIKELWDHGVRGYHLYIMNRSGMVVRLMERLHQAGIH
jgi:methylenetetrahydrofolate reductase (NADPH)